MTSPTVRTIREDELAAFIAVPLVAMHHMSPASDEAIEVRREIWELDRCLAAFDATGTLCGSARSFATQLSLPGGEVAAAAVSSVGVLPTHRRQGHFNRMMDAQLTDVAARGEPVAILVAAEYPIYGRYGYGPAAEACAVRLDTANGEFREPATGSVSLVDNKAFHDALVEVYDRAWARSHGHITWAPPFAEIRAGLRDTYDGGDEERRNARKLIWRDGDGSVQGVAAYTVRDDWVDNRPSGELLTLMLEAATDEAERELFRFLASVDWVATVRAGLRPVDDPLPLRLVDGRQAVLLDRSDHIWTRLLDVPAALTARRYATPDRIVFEVVDPLGFAAGRFALDAGPDGAACTRTDETADLAVPVGALGAAYLGGMPWLRLAAAGWVSEQRPGATARASAMFATARSPWCSTSF
jgi:predicted acetyltransferase